MKKPLSLFVLLTALMGGCASAPGRPDSLWDSLSSPQDGPAKQEPAKTWDSGSTTDSGNGSRAQGGTGDSGLQSVSNVVGTVVLNEIFYDSTDSDTDGHLFVELYGTPGLRLGGYLVNFINGSDGKVDDKVLLPASAKIRDDGFFLIADAKTGSTTVSNVPNADFVDNFDPQNGPDAVQLVDSKGGLVDAVGYSDGGEIVTVAQNGLATFEGTPAQDVPSGHSIERRAPGYDTHDNAADFVDREAPTPGSEPILPEEPVPDPAPSTPPVPDPVVDPVPPPVPAPAPSPQVVLNEIYYDAVGSDTNGVLFVELYGTPDASLAGDKINFVNGDDGKIYDTILLPTGSSLRSDGFYVIADAYDGSSTQTSVTGADFVDSFDPQNGPDAVQLLDSGGKLLDAVAYGSVAVFTAENGLPDLEGVPAVDVANGHSLERKTPGVDTGNNSDDFVERAVPTPGF